MKHGLQIINVFVLLLTVALGIPFAADQAESPAGVVRRDTDRKVRDLRNEIAQLQRELRDRRVNRNANTEDWQQAYREKLEQIRERQEFENKYLGSGE